MLVIRPTARYIKLATLLLVIAVAALDAAYYMSRPRLPAWPMAVPLVLLVWPAVRALRRHYTRAVLYDDRLHYEVGAGARTTRTIPLAKIQDVRVSQTVLQRMFGVGDISVETAGEASRLTIPRVENPQSVADRIAGRVPPPAVS